LWERPQTKILFDAQVFLRIATLRGSLDPEELLRAKIMNTVLPP
jgi:hypothetical protein